MIIKDLLIGLFGLNRLPSEIAMQEAIESSNELLLQIEMYGISNFLEGDELDNGKS